MLRNTHSMKFKGHFTTIKSGFLAGLILMIVGLGLAATEIFSHWRSQQTAVASQPISDVLANTPVPADEQAYISGTPVQISVPSVNIALKVLPGNYNPADNSWTLSRDNAHWGVMTRPANDKSGMTFIYAHYRKGVFLTLPKIKSGEYALVTTDKGHTFTYVFRASSVTTPDDPSIFAYQGKPILVLQTCTGAWFEKRQLFVFDLVKVE